jgi:superfamily II DNA/RNA helicase
VKFLVMDEADRLMDASFESDLRSLLTILPSDQRQTLLFSATMTASLVKLQQASLDDAYVFQVGGQLLSQLLQTAVKQGDCSRYGFEGGSAYYLQ